jgi:hypothetical protein
MVSVAGTLSVILGRVTGIIETHSLPTLTRSYPRRFTFYVAAPVSSIEQLKNKKPDGEISPSVRRDVSKLAR